jgi:hypothetical protein
MIMDADWKASKSDAKRHSGIDAGHGRRYTYRMARLQSSRVRTVSTSPQWDIYVVRTTPAKKWLGTVEAADVDAAIAEAIWRFDVKDSTKLIAVRRRP